MDCTQECNNSVNKRKLGVHGITKSVNSMDVTLGLYPRMQQFSQQRKLGVHGITKSFIWKVGFSQKSWGNQKEIEDEIPPDLAFVIQEKSTDEQNKHVYVTGNKENKRKTESKGRSWET